jgi:hypothetical protein
MCVALKEIPTSPRELLIVRGPKSALRSRQMVMRVSHLEATSLSVFATVAQSAVCEGAIMRRFEIKLEAHE